MTKPLDRDIVLFLGAGFSWDARLPLMREFGPQSIATQPDIERNAQRRRAGPMILEARDTYLAFERTCVKSGLLEEDDWANVEEVFGVAEALKYSGVEEVELRGTAVPTDELIGRIQVWIWKTYQQLPVLRGEARPEALPNREPYYQLFGALKDLDLARRTTIITTNYDIVAEYFAFLGGMPVHYPFVSDPSFGVTSSDRYFVSLSDTRNTGPMLCKLHGSVNFFQGPEGSFGVFADLGDGSEDVGRTGAGRFKGEPTIAMYDAVWKIQKDHPGWLPAIIPPSYAKLQQIPWLSETWEWARRSLTEAEAVVFIGYSLPRTDGFMRALLVGAQMLREDGSHPRIVVIDKSANVRKEYRRLYDTIEPDTEMSFAEAVEGTLPRILEEIAAP